MSSPMVPYAAAELLERVVIGGDLSKLAPAERLQYYREVCQSLGLNPLTRPLEYLHLSGKLTLYARRDATDQLRTLHGISVDKLEDKVIDGVYVVTAYLSNAAGRKDSDLGAVPIDGLKGEARANAMLKAVTKAKRRGTLSICGLGMLDETEVDSLPPEVVKPPPTAPATEGSWKPPAYAVAATAEVEPESGREEVPDPKEPVENWVKAFQGVTTVQAGHALWSSFRKAETAARYTDDEQTVVYDAKEAMKVRLGSTR